MKRAIFLDRDGVINKDRGYTFKIFDYELLPGVKQGLQKLQKAGFGLYVLTNQSGIGRGFYTENDYYKFTNYLLSDLNSAGIKIAGCYFCPHHPTNGQGEYKKDCHCRKPKSGLLLQAEKKDGPFDYRKSWVIGDSIRDIETVKNIHPEARGILLPKNYDTNDELSIEAKEKNNKSVNYFVENFLQAVDFILSE